MLKRIMLLIINIYQKAVSPFLPPACRFTPSCSEYAKEALSVYGVIKGSIMAMKRLLKCHPFHEGGYDPVR